MQTNLQQGACTMARTKSEMNKRYVYKVMDSPVGKLKLVGSDDGLAAILWENDPAGRVRLNIVAEDAAHPVLIETERQIKRVLCRRPAAVCDTAGCCRDGISAQGVECVTDDPVRGDAILRRDRAADRASSRRTSRWCGQRQKSAVDRGPLS